MTSKAFARYKWGVDDLRVVTRLPLAKHTPGRHEGKRAWDAYNPDQPRDPRGVPTGGRWTSVGAVYHERPFGSSGDPSPDLYDEIETHFDARGDPFELTQAVQDLDASPAEIRQAMVPTSFSAERPSLSLDQYSSGKRLLNIKSHGLGGNAYAYMHRSIDFESGVAHHVSFELPRNEQGAGIGREVLASQVGLYQRLGFNEVQLTANVDVGSYAWARYGFVPSSGRAWRGLADELQQDLTRWHGRGEVTTDDFQRVSRVLQDDDPRSIWRIADDRSEVTLRNRRGELLESTQMGYALLANRYWGGKLRLRDPEQMERFWRYVRR